MIYIGIDPGTNTGIAAWCSKTKTFLFIETTKIHRAILKIIEMKNTHPDICIVIENPNTWKPFSKNYDYAKLQGAGSIKRDYAIWIDLCKDYNIQVIKKSLHTSIKKLSQEKFEMITGFKKKVSVHARDAAMLVFMS